MLYICRINNSGVYMKCIKIYKLIFSARRKKEKKWYTCTLTATAATTTAATTATTQSHYLNILLVDPRRRNIIFRIGRLLFIVRCAAWKDETKNSFLLRTLKRDFASKMLF